ncbi:MAG: hypothetical protein AABY40_02830 [Nanoarchaeota archaeon]|mgnify:CR=1 FL=1
MHSIDSLLKIVAAEAVEGGLKDHYFDESRNREFIPPGPISPESRDRQPKYEPKLPSLRYTLELIKQPDGSYDWVE